MPATGSTCKVSCKSTAITAFSIILIAMIAVSPTAAEPQCKQDDFMIEYAI